MGQTLPIHVIKDLIGVTWSVTLHSGVPRSSLPRQMSPFFDYFGRVQTNILDHFNFLFPVWVPMEHIKVRSLPLQSLQQSLIFVLNSLHFALTSSIVQRFFLFCFFVGSSVQEILIHTLVHPFGRIAPLLVLTPSISQQTLCTAWLQRNLLLFLFVLGKDGARASQNLSHSLKQNLIRFLNLCTSFC